MVLGNVWKLVHNVHKSLELIELKDMWEEKEQSERNPTIDATYTTINIKPNIHQRILNILRII